MKNYPLNKVKYYGRFRDMIEDIGERYADAPAISWYTRKQEEKGVTYSQLREDVRNLQAKLIDLGLNGKNIAVVGENCYEWILVSFAANYCGSIVVFVDTEQSDDTIIQMLKTGEADAVFCSAAYQEICVQYKGAEGKMFLLNGKKEDIPTVDMLVKEGAKLYASGKDGAWCDEEVKPENTASIVFTSGTTSYSKAVMLSQEALLTNASDAMANVKIGKISFTHLPFYHAYGWTCSVLDSLIVGTHLYINGNLRTLARDLSLSKADTMYTVPLLLETIHNKMWFIAEQKGKKESLNRLFSLAKFVSSLGIKRELKGMKQLRELAIGNTTLIICGGAHAPLEILEEMQLMGINVLQGYGITECSPLVSVNRNEANRRGSVGFISAHTEVKIEDGEILVRGKNLMKGYYKDPEYTSEVMRDGWFCTGDMGEIDKDGYLYITGRKKNLIVFKNGKKVSPERLEERIKKIPLVQDVMVYGAGSGTSVDDVQVAASIYPNQEKTEGMTSYDILEYLRREIDLINDELPMYQQIQMITIREQEFSKTGLKKIKRHLT